MKTVNLFPATKGAITLALLGLLLSTNSQAHQGNEHFPLANLILYNALLQPLHQHQHRHRNRHHRHNNHHQHHRQRQHHQQRHSHSRERYSRNPPAKHHRH